MTTSGDHTTANDRSRRALLSAGAGVLVVAVVVAVVGLGPDGGGGPGRPPAAASATVREVTPDQAAGAAVEASEDTSDHPAPAVRSATPRPDAGAAAAPATWSEEVLAAEPGDGIRLAPRASDWTPENIVVGKDADGKFLGRVTVRYAGPGSARATFALAVLKQGEEIAVLTGELIEARAGVYQVLVHSPARFVDGPWETRFQVLSTA